MGSARRKCALDSECSDPARDTRLAESTSARAEESRTHSEKRNDESSDRSGREASPIWLTYDSSYLMRRRLTKQGIHRTSTYSFSLPRCTARAFLGAISGRGWTAVCRTLGRVKGPRA